jgi:hypothetical protein
VDGLRGVVWGASGADGCLARCGWWVFWPPFEIDGSTDALFARLRGTGVYNLVLGEAIRNAMQKCVVNLLFIKGCYAESSRLGPDGKEALRRRED